MNDPMDEAFEKWFEEFLKREDEKQTFTAKSFISQFPGIHEDLKEAFRQGWLKCEDWYGDTEFVIIVTPEFQTKGNLN